MTMTVKTGIGIHSQDIVIINKIMVIILSRKANIITLKRKEITTTVQRSRAIIRNSVRTGVT